MKTDDFMGLAKRVAPASIHGSDEPIANSPIIRPTVANAGLSRLGPHPDNGNMNSDRTLLSRYECKYFVAPSLLPRIRMMARPFVRLDPYSRRSPGLRYRISSLYLDAPDLALYSSTVQGVRNRFKLRIRSYADDPAAPVFCEIKRRSDRVVRKIRINSNRDAVQALVATGFDDASGKVQSGEMEEFVKRCRDVDARPFMRVRYLREAYESNGPDPVRITFDTNLSFSEYDASAPFGVGGEGWRATPVEGAIVEIKFTDHCPSWVTSIIDRLQLVRESIPKYVLCVDHARSQGILKPSTPSIERADEAGSSARPKYSIGAPAPEGLDE